MERKKIYVIRHLSYSYNDEYFSSYIHDRRHQGHMTALFENKEDAIQKWKQLEYDFSHKVNFQNIIECGQQHDFYGKEKILAQMSVDELFSILNQCDSCVYAVFEYPKQLKQQVFFDIQKNEYKMCYETTEYDIQENQFLQANFIENDPLLTDISPSTSRAIYSDIEYNHSCLVIKPSALTSINPLLKNPIEMRYLTIEEIYQLEKSLNQTYLKGIE